MFNEIKVAIDVRQRNAARARANLPLLSTPLEIARLRAVDEQVQFDAFVRQSRPLYERILARKVARVRSITNNWNYQPAGWAGRFAMHSYVMHVLRRIYWRDKLARQR